MSSRTAFKVLCALFVVAVFAPVADAQLNYTYTGAYTYPITLPAVSGYGTPLTRVSVTLNGLTTPNIHSLGIMLQGPNGKLVLIRNTGSPAAAAFSGNLTFADDAAATWPSSGTITAGSYKPKAYTTLPISFPAIFPEEPCCVFDTSEAYAPAGSATMSSTLNGTIPDGTWWLRITGTSVTLTSATLQLDTILDVQLTKSHTETFKQGENAHHYTISTRNIGARTLGSQTITVTDTLPTGLTAVGMAGTGWTCTNVPFACSRVGGITALQSLPDITATVNVSPTAPSQANNVATLSITGDQNASNNSSTDPTTVLQLADLTITNTDGQTTVVPGNPVTYTIVAHNNGPALITNAQVSAFFNNLTDVVYTATASGGATGFIASGTGGISNQVTFPSGSTVTYTMTGTVAPSTPAGPFAQTATISMPFDGFDTNTANNSVTDTDTSQPSSALSLSKTGPSFVGPNTDMTWTITLTNAGPSDAHNVSLTDVLPITFVSQTQTGGQAQGVFFTQSNNGNSITDTMFSMPPGTTATFDFVGHVPSNATPNQTIANTATVTCDNDPDTSNNSSTFTAHTFAPDLAIVKTHSQTFKQGDLSRVYTITVSNIGSGATAGTVTVADTLPAGLTNGVASGSGWTCSGSSPVACTRSSVLNAGASYPIIVVTVDVTSTAPPSVSNTATVSGGGEVNTANDSSTDVTAIVQAADLTVTQSQQPSAFSLGQTGAQLLFTVNNVGPGPTTGFVTFSTVLGGTGFTPTALAGTGWTCDVPTLTCTRSTALASGTSYPVITLTFDVEPDASATHTSDATVSGGGEINSANDTSHYDVVMFAPFGPPPNVVATTTGAAQVTISWNPVLNATSYIVSRATNVNGPFLPVATPASAGYVDNGLAANTTYLYKVQAVAGASTSGFSALDSATTTIFTDDPLAAGVRVKAVHILELRTAVNAMRAAANLAPFAFTDPGLTGGTRIKAAHVQEMRSALSQARAVFALPELFPTAITGGMVVDDSQIALIRTGCK